MKHVAIVYATRMGHTEKIVARMKSQLEERGCSVSIYNLKIAKPQIDTSIDTVIYGGPIYASRLPFRLTRWVRTHHADLRRKTTALFTVSLNRADFHLEARSDDDRILREQISLTGFAPNYVESFGGCLAYSRYPRPLRWKMREIATRAGGSVDTSRDHDYTNWDDVEAFIEAIDARAVDSKFLCHRRLPHEVQFNSTLPEFEHTFSSSISLAGFSADEVFSIGKLKSVWTTLLHLFSIERPVLHREFYPDEEIIGFVGRIVGLRWKKVDLEDVEFANFNERGCAKVVARLSLRTGVGGITKATYDVRVHSTDSYTLAKMRIYFLVMASVVRLAQRRTLRSLYRSCTALITEPIVSEREDLSVWAERGGSL